MKILFKRKVVFKNDVPLKSIGLAGVFINLFVFTNHANSGAPNIGTLASNITSTFGKIALLITASSYIAGLAFAIGAIMKFKQHKESPTNVPIGTPMMMVFVAGALLFLPSILSITGGTMFGTSGSTATPYGKIFSST